MIALLILLAFFSLLLNLNNYVFRGEEALRVYVAYHMVKTNNYLQPYVLGEPYYNKPPLFNWLIALYSQFIPWSELTARMVSITSLLLCIIVIFTFSKIVFKNLPLSILSSLVFLTFGNVLFFYGYLAEIDTTYTLFVFSTMVSLYMWSMGNSFLWGIFGAFLAGLSALLKGLPSYAFYFISLFTFSVYYRRLDFLLGKKAFLLHFISIAIPLIWLINTENPKVYFETLFHESFSRVSNAEFSRLRHLFIFPLISFKDLLPYSLLFIYSIYLLFKHRRIEIPSSIKLLSLLFIFNYIPYLLAKSSGRYTMPIYPIMAIIFSYYIHSAFSFEKLKRVFYIAVILAIVFRFIYGFTYFPYRTYKEGSKKAIAEEIVKRINLNANIECNCRRELAICLYISFAKGEPLKRKLPNADYSITCQEEDKGEEIMNFDVKKPYKIRVLKLNQSINIPSP